MSLYMTWKSFWDGFGKFMSGGLANFGTGSGYAAGGFSPQSSPTYDPKDPPPLVAPSEQGIEQANTGFDTSMDGTTASSFVGGSISHF